MYTLSSRHNYFYKFTSNYNAEDIINKRLYEYDTITSQGALYKVSYAKENSNIARAAHDGSDGRVGARTIGDDCHYG